MATDDSIICHRNFVCWITKATDAHSGVCNTSFPQPQRLWKCTTVLRYMYIAFLVSSEMKRTQLYKIHNVIYSYQFYTIPFEGDCIIPNIFSEFLFTRRSFHTCYFALYISLCIESYEKLLIAGTLTVNVVEKKKIIQIPCMYLPY
jgi:hypothetical protein